MIYHLIKIQKFFLSCRVIWSWLCIRVFFEEVSLEKRKVWHSSEGGFQQLKKKVTELKKTLKTRTHTFPEPIKKFSFPILAVQIKQKQKSKSSFLLIFILKIAFKPNKSQESQVSSQDHHNQNGENPLKEESIQHWASNYFLFLIFLNYFISVFYSFIWFCYFCVF